MMRYALHPIFKLVTVLQKLLVFKIGFENHCLQFCVDLVRVKLQKRVVSSDRASIWRGRE
jgi:hypothetical protein